MNVHRSRRAVTVSMSSTVAMEASSSARPLGSGGSKVRQGCYGGFTEHGSWL